MSEEKIQEEIVTKYEKLLHDFYDVVPVERKKKGKLKGAIFANLIRNQMQEILEKNSLPFNVSENNVFVEGFPVECDLLIVKKGCELVLKRPVIYRAEDVQAVIECKASGLFVKRDGLQNPFANELRLVEELQQRGAHARFGYISLGEELSGKPRTWRLDIANSWINRFDRGQKNTGVYCFAEIKSSGSFRIFEGNGVSFEEYVKKLCDFE